MRYQRVLLIQPNYAGSRYRASSFPIGLGYIAEALKKASIEYDVVDMGVHPRFSYLVCKIQEFKPDLIGISMLSSMFRNHYKLAEKLKGWFPNVTIIAGGPHISTFRDQVLTGCSAIDYLATLEGEQTMVELCKGVPMNEVKGLMFVTHDGIQYTGDRPFISELDSLPFPTYDKFDKYDEVSINLTTSRGCPYACIYCPVKTTIGQKLRVRSAKNIVDEVEYWYKRGYRKFCFVDDNFTFYRDRVFRFCEEVDSRGLQIEMNFGNGIRADKVDRALLERMKSSGLTRVAFGVEAGTDRILKNIKKGETLKDITEAIEMACDIGLDVALFFLIGSPGETEEDVKESFKLSQKYRISDVRFYNLVPFPGTELYEWVLKNNYFVRSVEEYCNGGLHWANKPIFYTPTLSTEQRKAAFRRGMSMGRKLRSAALYKSYVSSFRKFGRLAPFVAFIASRTLVQERLSKIHFVQHLRRFLKSHSLYDSRPCTPARS